MLVYGWKLVDYPEKLGPEGQFYSPIIWESVNKEEKLNPERLKDEHRASLSKSPAEIYTGIV